MQKQIKNKKLYDQIDKILYKDWDPKYIQEDGPSLRDEYTEYIPVLLQLKMSGADKETIAKKLFEIETETIGLSNYDGLIDSCREIAQKIIEVK